MKGVFQNEIEKTMNSDSFGPFMAGIVGGIAEWFIGHPLDTIRVRVMSDTSTKSTMTYITNAITNPLGKHGILSLYRGSRSEILSSAFTGSFIFGCTSFIRNFITSLSSKSYDEDNKNKKQQHDNDDDDVNASLIIASATTGLIDGLASKPFEMIKSRQQIASTSSKRLRSTIAIKSLLNEGGVSTFFRGWFPCVVRDSLGNAAFFVAYQTVKNKLKSYKDTNNIEGNNIINEGSIILLAGAAAGLAYVIVSHPFETIGTLMQIDVPTLALTNNGLLKSYTYKYTNMNNCFKQIIDKNGIKGLYRGAGATLLRAIPSYALSFYGYEVTLRAIENRKPKIKNRIPKIENQ
jgi:solute carrier family 25 carnitine/acylcarnitine transporter 20/29